MIQVDARTEGELAEMRPLLFAANPALAALRDAFNTAAQRRGNDAVAAIQRLYALIVADSASADVDVATYAREAGLPEELVESWANEIWDEAWADWNAQGWVPDDTRHDRLRNRLIDHLRRQGIPFEVRDSC
jgi:hypothetical protein